MINNLLFKLAGNLPCRIIELDSGPYLERYYVGNVLGVTFYLHRFVSSDSEEHIHNHPWEWGRSVILTGSYIEETICDFSADGLITDKKRRRWLNRVDGNTFHRIHEAAPGTWSLFFHSPRAKIGGKSKGWGFLEKKKNGQIEFVPAESATLRWWEEAPKGKEIERS